MKKLLLVVSHLGANSGNLCQTLDQSRMVQWIKDGFIYSHPTDVTSFLSAIEHKYSNHTGLYLNEILYNYQIAHKSLYEAGTFLYLVRDPKNSVKVSRPKDATWALDYYIFRLRRIYEMAKETKNGIFVTWNDLANKKGFPFVMEKLNLVDNIEFKEQPPEKKLFELPKNLLREAENAYNLCLYRVGKIAHLSRMGTF